MASNTIRCITKFNSYNEKIVAYLERVQLFFTTNGNREEKQVPILLTVIGSTTYASLSNLVAPDKHKDKSFCDLSEVLRRHFDLRPLVTAKRFHFHHRDQAPDKSISNYVAELR